MDGVAAYISDGPVGGCLERVHVEPLYRHVRGVHLARAGIRILAGHVIRTGPAVSAVRAISIVAGIELLRRREPLPALHRENAGELPSGDDLINKPIDARGKTLPAAERRLEHKARGPSMAHIEVAVALVDPVVLGVAGAAV